MAVAERACPIAATGAGMVLLPGLRDLHTHLREPGREDAERLSAAAAALGGYTAVFVMPNTDPVADTAGVVEQVWRRGTLRVGRCSPSERALGRRARSSLELGAMADSPARVRPQRRRTRQRPGFDAPRWSTCVRLVIAQHAEEPRLTEARR